jgi:hypothetical protein
MISKSLFINVAMIAISIGIVITYVEPTFSEISKLQEDISVYQNEQKKVSEVNNQLSSLIDVLTSVYTDDERRLLTYMPDQIDPIDVVRDLSLISKEIGLTNISPVFEGKNTEKNQNREARGANTVQPEEYRFALSAGGTYSQIKNLFLLLEQNDYPLEVQSLSLVSEEEGVLFFTATLSVYTYKDSATREEIVF